MLVFSLTVAVVYLTKPEKRLKVETGLRNITGSIYF